MKNYAVIHSHNFGVTVYHVTSEDELSFVGTTDAEKSLALVVEKCQIDFDPDDDNIDIVPLDDQIKAINLDTGEEQVVAPLPPDIAGLVYSVPLSMFPTEETPGAKAYSHRNYDWMDAVSATLSDLQLEGVHLEDAQLASGSRPEVIVSLVMGDETANPWEIWTRIANMASAFPSLPKKCRRCGKYTQHTVYPGLILRCAICGAWHDDCVDKQHLQHYYGGDNPRWMPIGTMTVEEESYIHDSDILMQPGTYELQGMLKTESGIITGIIVTVDGEEIGLDPDSVTHLAEDAFKSSHRFHLDGVEAVNRSGTYALVVK